ncbi:MAG: AMP-binding protein [Dehalococcoidia bacterium]|nr:AMP-binding protein [Dehalococcoidia bacterium]
MAQMTIPAMFEEAVRRHERKAAFQMKVGREYRELTYGDLYRRARAFASGLVALGMRPGDRVGLVAENGFEWVTAYLGLSMAGGVGVPVYYELKPPEIEDALKRAEARFVVTSAKVLPKIPERLSELETVFVIGDGAAAVEARSSLVGFLYRRPRARLLPFEAVAEQATPESDTALAAIGIKPEDLASIVYTSGTTGGAKGVMLTHGNFVSNVSGVPQIMPVGERDKILLLLPLHHAYPFTVEFLLPLAVGATVVIENDLVRVRDRLSETHPTVFAGVPALFDIMLRAIRSQAEAQGRGQIFQRGLDLVARVKERTGINIGHLVFRELHARLGGRLRFMASGGAALSPDTARTYYKLGLLLLQGWGLTETSPIITGQRFYPSRFRLTNYYEKQLGSVGKPLPAVDVTLIDVPEKEIYVLLHDEGELTVRGPNVTPGYWKAEPETRAAKIGEWLRTGDVGRIDKDGNVFITGRSKYVIVLESGEKVHPDEVEGLLQTSPLIEDVAVVGRNVRGKTQVSCVVYPNYAAVSERLAGNGQSVDERTVREIVTSEIDRLEETIAPYKRTVDCTLTDSPLPKTALRKVARELLSESYSFDVKRWQESSASLSLT